MLKPLYEGVNLLLNKRAVRVDAAKRRVQFEDGTEEGYEALVSTIPLPQLVALMPEAPADVREAAGILRALRHYCVNFIVEREAVSPANWFYIYDSDIDVSRVSFPFSLSGERNGTTPIQAEIFVPGDARPDEESLREKALADVCQMLNLTPSEFSAAEIRCMPVSYVISDLHRAAAVRLVREWLKGQGIETTGLYGQWEYIWSDRAYASGRALAKSMQEW